MNTKLKGDIAEQSAIVKALKFGWGVLQPIGDRLSYDLVFEINCKFVRVQVKSAWFDDKKENYVVDNRRSKTNQQKVVHKQYQKDDFDFALLFIEDLDLFYVMPVEIFISYGSEIHLIETKKRQRKPLSAEYRDAWNLILHWAA